MMTPMLFFLFFIPLLGIILLCVNFILAPHKPYKEKKTPFECGYHSFLSQNRTQFNVVFFIFSILFLLFDLEIVLIFPFMLSSYENQVFGLVAMIIFTILITVGFIYELGKGALKIKSKQEHILSQPGAHKSLYKGRYNTRPILSKYQFFYIAVLVKGLFFFFKNILSKANYSKSPIYIIYCTAKKPSIFEVLKTVLNMLYNYLPLLSVKCPNYIAKSPLYTYSFVFYNCYKILFYNLKKKHPFLCFFCACLFYYHSHSLFSTTSLLLIFIFSALGKLYLEFFDSRLKNKFPFAYDVLAYIFDIVLFTTFMLLAFKLFENLYRHIKDYIFNMQKGSTGSSGNSGGSGNNNPNPSGGNPGPSGGNPGPSGSNSDRSEDKPRRKYRKIFTEGNPPTEFPTTEPETELSETKGIISFGENFPAAKPSESWSDMLEKEYARKKEDITIKWDVLISNLKIEKCGQERKKGVYSKEAKEVRKQIIKARTDKLDELSELYEEDAKKRRLYYQADRDAKKMFDDSMNPK